MINEHYIVIVGKTPIETKLDDAKELSIAFKRLACSGIVKTPLEDGNYAYTYKLKNLDEVTIIDGDEVIRGKPKKGSQSQALRFAIRSCWSSQHESGETELDFDEFYKREMSAIIKTYDEA